MTEFKEKLLYAGRYFRTFYRWLMVATVTGAVCGLVGSVFNLIVGYATELRSCEPWLLLLLPIGGIAIAAIYRISGVEGEGTNNIIDSIHEGERLPILLVPAIFLATAITHLFGGSAGREGAALQIGGSLGYKVGAALRLDDKDMRIVTLCGMSAVFAALFGTPLTAAIFALEVISVGVIYYSAFIPCLVSSLVAYAISRLCGIEPMSFAIAFAPMEVTTTIKVVIIGVACAVVSMVFCVAMHKGEALATKCVKSPFLRAAIGGVIVILLTVICGSGDYNGAGIDVIETALTKGSCPDRGFLWKIAFTAVTIGCGFKGGEIVPTFFIGATFGCFLGPIIGLSAPFAAALGLAAVFCGAVNCPIASIILSVELFGSGNLIYFALACGISYMLSGYYGLYSSQKIMYSKTRAEFINRHAL